MRAWRHTYGLPTVVTNCSNNYGPYHFPEKLIPLMILNALEGKPLPVYGRGDNVRDWLYVEDHAEALLLRAIERARVGETYNIGGTQRAAQYRRGRRDLRSRRRVRRPTPASSRAGELITFVADRPGHDLRYAIDAPRSSANSAGGRARPSRPACARPFDWYLDNRPWWQAIRSGTYRGERLGLSV